MIFPLKDVDRRFYQEHLAGFLPSKMVDIHTHVWLKAFRVPMPADTRGQTWPRHVAEDNAIEDLLETYRLLLPEQEVTPLIFGWPERDADMEQTNAYTSRVARQHNLPGSDRDQPRVDGRGAGTTRSQRRFPGLEALPELGALAYPHPGDPDLRFPAACPPGGRRPAWLDRHPAHPAPCPPERPAQPAADAGDRAALPQYPVGDRPHRARLLPRGYRRRLRGPASQPDACSSTSAPTPALWSSKAPCAPSAPAGCSSAATCPSCACACAASVRTARTSTWCPPDCMAISPATRTCAM